MADADGRGRAQAGPTSSALPHAQVASPDQPALTVAVSSLGARAQALASWPLDPRVRWLLLWQAPQGEPPPGWEVRRLSTRGVAHSRNAAIDACETPWLWFQDDDVALPAASLDALLVRLRRSPPHRVHIAAVRDTAGRWRHRRRDRARYGRIALLALGTIQIVCHVGFVRHAGAHFWPLLGAGAPLPACDEPVFLADLLRHGAQLRHAAAVVVVHPPASSGEDLASDAALQARAVAFREIFGMPWAVGVAAAFAWRYRRAIGGNFRPLFDFSAAARLLERRDRSGGEGTAPRTP